MVIRVGIVGLSTNPTAWATIAHYKPLTEKPLSDHYKLVAVATSSKASAKAAAEAFGLPEDKGYDSAEALAKDKDVDLVTISIKVPLHHQAALPSLNAKKSTVVEWPLGANTTQAEELANLAKKQGLKTGVVLQTRASPTIQKIKSIVDSGALGRVFAITFVVSSSLFETAPKKYEYMNDPNSGASVVSIPVIHMLDPICYVFGEFKELEATLSNNFSDWDLLGADGKPEKFSRNFADSVRIQGVLEPGTSFSYVLNSTTKGTPEQIYIMIYGEKASLKIEGDNAFMALAPPKISIYEKPSQEEWKGPEAPPAAGSWKPVDVKAPLGVGSVGEVYEALTQTDSSALVTFDEAVKRHRMIDAIVKSAANGTKEKYV